MVHSRIRLLSAAVWPAALLVLSACNAERQPSASPDLPVDPPAAQVSAAPVSADPAKPSEAMLAATEKFMREQTNCFVCHKTDSRVMGPSYREIADRYRDDPNARQIMIDAVVNGSEGKWGALPMTPHPDLQSDQLDAIADWILSLPPAGQ
jgi:cytochrome c